MLHTYQEQEDARDEREVDLQVAGQAQQTHHQRMPKQDQDAERNSADVLSVAMQLGDERRHEDHEEVVDVDGEQAIEIMQRVHDDMRERAPYRGEDRNVDEALAPDNVRIFRDNADGQEPIDPGRQTHRLPSGLAHEIAKSRHGN